MKVMTTEHMEQGKNGFGWVLPRISFSLFFAPCPPWFKIFDCPLFTRRYSATTARSGR
jgi:hypothetical protein